MHGGLGPVLATWLAAAEWSPARIGPVMTASGIAGPVFNGPAGALADRSGRPRLLLGLAAGALIEVLANPRLVALGCALLLFHLGNAAMLPLLGEHMAVIGHGEATRWMAACVITAQLGMIPVAVVAGRAAEHGSRVRLLAIACAVLVVRGGAAAFADQPLWLIPVQILDACGAGLLGVAVPILVAHFTLGTGRTQTGLGAAATFQGIGAALSNTLGGALASWVGWGAAFLGLAGPAFLALLIALWLGGMPPGAGSPRADRAAA